MNSFQRDFNRFLGRPGQIHDGGATIGGKGDGAGPTGAVVNVVVKTGLQLLDLWTSVRNAKILRQLLQHHNGFFQTIRLWFFTD